MSSRRPSSSAVNVAELKRHFSGYLDRISNQGDRVVVRRRNRDVAVLAPVEEVAQDAEAAAFKGKGFLAIIGAWGDDEEIDRMVADIRSARRRTRYRKDPPLG